MTRSTGAAPELEDRLTRLGFPTLRLVRVGGGDINEVFRAETTRGPVFVKTHASPPEPLAGGPTFFRAEARGLETLARAGLMTPAVLAVDERCLVLEWLEPAACTPKAEREAGRALAALHQQVGPRFGLDHDNFMGAIPQANGPLENGDDPARDATSFARFFRERRLLPLVALARLGPAIARRIERLPLETLLSPTTPRLVHGDLWAGNLHYAAVGPRFIDPAIAYGHPEQDLAMTRLFGGFSEAFYEGYREHSPSATAPFDQGFDERLDVLTLYPLLVHVALFGGGYLRQVEAILDRFE